MNKNDKEKELIIISRNLIPDNVLKKEIITLLNKMSDAISKKSSPSNFEKNIIDPFSYLFEKIIYNIEEIEKWKDLEFKRQLNKTLLNHVGKFHQNLLCSLEGCYEPKEGGVDFVCDTKKIVAEIKNKWNTTNSKSKTGSYDELAKALDDRKEYTGYFVTVIPKSIKNYCAPFAMTKNKKKIERRKLRNDILTINAEFFYEKITDEKNILKSIYYRMPDLVISVDSSKTNLFNKTKKDSNFDYFLLKALGNL